MKKKYKSLRLVMSDKKNKCNCVSTFFYYGYFLFFLLLLQCIIVGRGNSSAGCTPTIPATDYLPTKLLPSFSCHGVTALLFRGQVDSLPRLTTCYYLQRRCLHNVIYRAKETILYLFLPILFLLLKNRKHYKHGKFF